MLIAIRLDPEVLARFRKEAKRRNFTNTGDPPGWPQPIGLSVAGEAFCRIAARDPRVAALSSDYEVQAAVDCHHRTR